MRAAATSMWPPLQTAMANGYPSFQSEQELEVVRRSPRSLQMVIPAIADVKFKELPALAVFSTESLLVRRAFVAYSTVFGRPYDCNMRNAAMNSYQSCVVHLQEAIDTGSVLEGDFALTAIFLFGIFEGLRLQDASNSVRHFEAVRMILTVRLSRADALADTDVANLYRVIAECTIYVLSTLSPYCSPNQVRLHDWGTAFDCLFSADGYSESPILGGLHQIYRIMFRAGMLSNQVACMPGPHSKSSTTIETEGQELWQELNLLEERIPTLYTSSMEDLPTKRLARAKHRLNIIAIRIHLRKIRCPTADSSDACIRQYLSDAIRILKEQDMREPGIPAMRWPLTVLACAAETTEAYDFVAKTIREYRQVIDPANSHILRSVCQTIDRFRAWRGTLPLRDSRGILHPKTQLDYLLVPSRLILGRIDEERL